MMHSLKMECSTVSHKKRCLIITFLLGSSTAQFLFSKLGFASVYRGISTLAPVWHGKVIQPWVSQFKHVNIASFLIFVTVAKFICFKSIRTYVNVEWL